MIGQLPAKSQALAGNGELNSLYVEFLSEVYFHIAGMQASGFKRPTTNLYPGRYFFDTSLGSLGKPIWIGSDGKTWIDASGATV